MFDTPTTAFYHGPNQQNVKSLFSAIPSGLPALPTLVSLSFSNYFQQPSQQDTRLSSIVETTSTDLNSAPTAPQQPTHTNRRTQRRTTQKQQNSASASKSATVPQRVVSSNSNSNNMGNVNSLAAQPSKTPSSIISTLPSTTTSPPSSPSPHHNHHNHHRRKKYSNKINRKKVDEAITLSAFAVEEDNQGNHDVAIEFYLSAIENMLEALPIHANQTRKDALKNKLRDFMDREGLTDDFMESTNASSTAKAIEREENKSNPDNDKNNGSGISDHIIKAAITSAVALKQSPIPDAISATVNYTMKKIQKIDQTYGLQDKAWEISRSGINKAIEIDQQYNVHQKVGNAFFVGFAAAMKAGIAYKDAIPYREIQKLHTEFQSAGSLNIKEESSSS